MWKRYFFSNKLESQQMKTTRGKLLVAFYLNVDESREYWMIYRGRGYSPDSSPDSSPPSPVSLSQSFFVSPVELTDGRDMVKKELKIRRRESLDLHKSFNTLCEKRSKKSKEEYRKGRLCTCTFLGVAGFCLLTNRLDCGHKWNKLQYHTFSVALSPQHDPCPIFH